MPLNMCTLVREKSYQLDLIAILKNCTPVRKYVNDDVDINAMNDEMKIKRKGQFCYGFF